ncbi:hypothetical protein BD309DRAFT_991277 [Dichomitus squalens]|nr:hypothetical protein BD309DRAFT_991277 [Dichomitus squalens]
MATPTKKKRGSWADLDLSIVVALVSPIGNWLTGGDHMKNIFLIILLILYLHQIIEIPWQLYLSARPRKPGHSSRSQSPLTEEDEKLARFSELARHELRRHELAYFVLAVASPFIGAAFLRYVLSALGEPNTLSWFSTTLFVLATGIRPWSHLISRLEDRTRELHTALHYPDEDSLMHKYGQTNRVLQSSLKRIDALESELAALRESVQRVEQLREVCDELTEVLGEVERIGKRNERKADAGRAAQSVRLTALEQGLAQLEQRRQRDMAAFEAVGIHLPKGHDLLKQARSSLATAVDKLLYVPRAIILFGLEDPYQDHNNTKHEEFRLHLPVNGANGNGVSHRRIRSPEREKHMSHLIPRLPTIPEAEDSDSEETFVSDKEGTHLDAVPVPQKHGRRSSSGGSSSSPRYRKKTLAQKSFDFAQNLVLWPYRVSVRILVAVIPPLRNVLPHI